MNHSLSEEKIKNLKALRGKLAENVDNLKIDMQFFHAKNFGAVALCRTIATAKDFECGSTCCGIGYAAHWGIGLENGKREAYHNPETGVFKYFDYSRDLFCSNSDKFEGYDFGIFDYLFAGVHDNDVNRLIDRIDAVLKNDVKLALSVLEFDTKQFFE